MGFFSFVAFFVIFKNKYPIFFKKIYFSDFTSIYDTRTLMGKIRKVWLFAPYGMNNRAQGKFSENLVFDKLEFSLNTAG